MEALKLTPADNFFAYRHAKRERERERVRERERDGGGGGGNSIHIQVIVYPGPGMCRDYTKVGLTYMHKHKGK